MWVCHGRLSHWLCIGANSRVNADGLTEEERRQDHAAWSNFFLQLCIFLFLRVGGIWGGAILDLMAVWLFFLCAGHSSGMRGTCGHAIALDELGTSKTPGRRLLGQMCGLESCYAGPIQKSSISGVMALEFAA